jgi:hypothetical protein
MAAGLGYKEFTTGDILTAADANGYLASQVVMVFASAAARTSAIASPQEGMISYLKDTNSTEYYSGTAWVAIGGGSSGGLTLLATTTLTGGATTVSGIVGGYKNLLFVIKNVQQSVDDNGAYLTLNGDSGTNYQYINYRMSASTLSGQSNNDSTIIDNFFNSSTSGTSPANLGTATINLYRYTDTDVVQGDWRFSCAKNDGTPSGTTGQFSYNCSAAITSLTLTAYSGTFSGGTIYTYGVN